MILPPLPLDPNGQEWTDDEAKIIQAYGELCIKAVCGGKHTKKFSERDVAIIRSLHEQGFAYKAVNRQIEMSAATFFKIVNRRGAYK